MCRKLTLLMNVIFILFKTNINIVVTNMINEYQYRLFVMKRYLLFIFLFIEYVLHFSFFLLFTCLF